ncbi:MAG: hypothetical protein ABW063_01950 [Caulobacter sp.]
MHGVRDPDIRGAGDDAPGDLAGKTQVWLPSQPGVPDADKQSALTALHLTPQLDALEAFFLHLRATVDPQLSAQLPVKLGKPYPLGQCLEISLGVAQALRRFDAGDNPLARRGGEALVAFCAAGGQVRRVWGDLRGQFFQNAFQVGSLYVDVANDSVVIDKPKVEILPFDCCGMAAIRNFEHFADLAGRYWGDRVLPNHILPDLAPYFPLIHLAKDGGVLLREPSDYMVTMAMASEFEASRAFLAAHDMPDEVFKALQDTLCGVSSPLAASPREGRADAIFRCDDYREQGWTTSMQIADRHVRMAEEINLRLTSSQISLRA